MVIMNINKNSYTIPELNFNAMCELEEKGVDLISFVQSKGKNSLSTIRGFVAWVMNTDIETASSEIEQYISNGGNLVYIINCLISAVEESGFSTEKTTEETTGSSKNESFTTEKQKNWGSFTEIINEVWIPLAITLDLTLEEFWKSTPKNWNDIETSFKAKRSSQ